VREQFKPAQSTGAGLESDFRARTAHALEYIAVQLGEINARLEAQDAAVKKKAGDEIQKELKASTAKKQAAYGTRQG